jgi:hypothetical protein
MEVFLVLAGYFCVATLFFGSLSSIVWRLRESDPRHHRYGIPRDRSLSSDN